LKTPTKDILLIAVALLVILGCGYVVGKRSAPEVVEIDPTPPTVEVDDFQEMVLSKLGDSLHLTPEQIADIRPDIKSTNDQITKTRKRALFEFYLHVRELHDKIGPKLDPQQQDKLRKDREKLQEVIEKRFPSLLDKPGGGSQSSE